MDFRRSRFLALFFAAWLLALTACSHYRLGTGSEPLFRRLYVAPVENSAALPQTTALYTQQVREAFLRDGRLTLVNRPEDADVILSLDLGSYRRVTTSALPADTGLARKFDLELEARATLKATAEDKVYFADRPLAVTRQIFTTPSPTSTVSEQQQAEYTVQPLLAQALAERAVHAVLDTW